MRDVPWIGEEPRASPPPDADTGPWGLEESTVPAPVVAALSFGAFAVLAVVAVFAA